MRWLSGARGAKTAPADAGSLGGDVAHEPVSETRPSPSRRELDAAYEKGRREGSRRRRGSPLLGFVTLLIVAAAGTLFYLAIQNGSFASGGAVVDNNISQVSQTAQAPFKKAADKAGGALETAGRDLKQRAGDQPTQP